MLYDANLRLFKRWRNGSTRIGVKHRTGQTSVTAQESTVKVTCTCWNMLCGNCGDELPMDFQRVLAVLGDATLV